MKHLAMSAMTAFILLSGATLTMAASSDNAAPMRHGSDNGDMYTEPFNSVEAEDLYGADDRMKQSSSNNVAVAECERLLAQGRIGQRGQTRGSEVSVVGRNCDRLFDGSAN